MCTEATCEIQIGTRLADFGADMMAADRRLLPRAPTLLTIPPADFNRPWGQARFTANTGAAGFYLPQAAPFCQG
jgi:hypothetical protein